MNDALSGKATEISTLGNGVRVATETMAGVASVSLGVWIGAGARHESAAENGVAHFLEHMAFKGTATRTARQIAEEIEDVGGYLNAYTSREATAYYARVLAEDAPKALEILADILRAPRFAAEDVEVERGVILQEIGQALDTPDDIVFDWAQDQAFPDQPIGRAILGPAGNVERIGAPELRGFMERRYAPDQIVVAAAGAVAHGEVLALAERLFGDWPAGARSDMDAAAYAGGERRVEKPLEQAHVVLGFEGPGYRDEDFFAAQVYATLLGGGMSSRLFQEAREARGLCYTIFSQPSFYRETGLLTIYAGTGGDQTRELIEVIAEQMRRVPQEAAADELARAKAQHRASLLMGLESSSARAERLGRALLAQGRIAPVSELLEKLEAVDLAALKRFAERTLASPPTLTLYGPVASAPGVAELSERLAA
ncbi:MAG: pitrilysin family protein [Pseudomonadota bacterium]